MASPDGVRPWAPRDAVTPVEHAQEETSDGRSRPSDVLTRTFWERSSGHRKRSSTDDLLWCAKENRSGAPGRIRTCGTWFRKPLLYPLSYEGLMPPKLIGAEGDDVHLPGQVVVITGCREGAAGEGTGRYAAGCEWPTSWGRYPSLHRWSARSALELVRGCAVRARGRAGRWCRCRTWSTDRRRHHVARIRCDGYGVASSSVGDRGGRWAA
jgi:hypothetical protein